MIIKSKAPFRIGLAGGGTDVEPYASMYGGEVVNASIGLYARAMLETTEDGMFYAEMKGFPPIEFPLGQEMPLTGNATDLITATYKRFRRDHGSRYQGLAIQVVPDVSVGSGLGTSSTIVVSLCGAFLRLYGLEWEPMRIAEYACSIEREDLGWPGGKQDQYAAVMGGFNHFTFAPDGRVSIDPIHLSASALSMLEQSLVLFHTSQQRHSASIITEQQRHILNSDRQELEASHRLKALALEMRDALKHGDIEAVGSLLNKGFATKKLIASGISNPALEKVYDAAMRAGATGGKISGAGGGGFILFFTPPSKRVAVQNALITFEGREFPFHFTGVGLSTWTE